MNLMKGKKGLIMGVANERSIAWGIAQKLSEAGAELAFTYLGDAEKKEEVSKLFKDIKSHWGAIDFVVHAIAFQINQNYQESILIQHVKTF